MDCQCCNKKPARIRICDVESNNVADQFNVCPDCWTFVRRYLFDMAKPLLPTADVLKEVRELLANKETALLVPDKPGELAVPEKAAAAPVPVCPVCGLTLAGFKAKGRFGCAKDYELFAEHLDPLFERIHDATPPRHKGRGPRQTGRPETMAERSLRIEGLKRDLKEAVSEENYELAARLRDQINELERAQERPQEHHG
ncbi:MAG: UvrB/UvrC motif-containing protein [Planctomycetes bacterium]|nr:UvrB/UvrC motif-containing protein [Planctomycetota bacterium]